MRIQRLTVQDVRRHRGTVTLDLAPGLTIIRGPNEAGKSTLLRALELAFTRRVTSTSADIDALRTWGVPEDRRPEVGLTFTYHDGAGEHRGRLEKAFRGTKGAVVLELDGETITDPGLADERLAEITGIPSEGFFRSTASVRHHELAAIVRDEAALRDRLQASISGADEGTSRARRKLKQAILELNTKGAKNPGHLRRAEDQLDETRRRLQDGEAALARLERDRDALARAREGRAAAEAVLLEERASLERARIAERLEAERARAQERFERAQAAVQAQAEVTRLASSPPSPHAPATLREAIGRVRSIDRRVLELSTLLGGDVEPAAMPDPVSRWMALGWLAATLVVLGVLGVVLGGGLVGVALALGGAAMAALAVRVRATDAATAVATAAERTRRRMGRAQLQAELDEGRAAIGAALAALGLEDVAAAEALLARQEAHAAASDAAAARLEGLVGRAPAATLPDVRDAAALELEQKAAALRQLGPLSQDARARERLPVAVADAERAMEVARDEEAAARARVEHNAVDAEEVAALDEALGAQAEALAVLRRRDRVYRATLAAIEAAEKATLQTATRYLERTMVHDVARISGGRYGRVRVDDADLAIQVWAPERDDWVPVTELSQGTVDLVYLAARLGLVRHVTGGRTPPLVLDDPFVTLDDGRATRALELLRELASDFQVLYLTASDRYDPLADMVIALPGPAVAEGQPPAGTVRRVARAARPTRSAPATPDVAAAADDDELGDGTLWAVAHR